MSNPIVYLAIDVAKATLDAFCQGKTASLPNTRAAISKLYTQMQAAFPQSTLHVVCEATGGYERTLVRVALELRLPVSVVAPLRVRKFAEACGILAKTDRIDAALIARFAATVQPCPLQPSEKTLQELHALVCLKQQIQEHRTRLLNQLEKLSEPKLQRLMQRLIKNCDKEAKAADALIDALLKADGKLGQKVERLANVQGIGKATATGIVALMPELGSISGNRAAALAGLAPFNRDSGPHKGQRSIKGGRRKVRALLYMPALSATRFNPVLSAFYKRLLDNGKKPLLAITAVMRKLIVLFNRLLSQPEFSLAA